MNVAWACPKCDAPANKHGKGGSEKCAQDSRQGSGDCPGFICECDDDGLASHGESFDDVCSEAHCYHCGWRGTFPATPKGLAPWEKKALEAGWTPPASRAKELGLKEKKT